MQDVAFRLSAEAKASLMKLKARAAWPVLLYLAELAAGLESFRVRCEDIARECSMSRNTAQKMVRALERIGLLRVLGVKPCLTLQMTECVFIAEIAMIAKTATLTSTSSYLEEIEVLLGYWNHWGPRHLGIEILDLGKRNGLD